MVELSLAVAAVLLSSALCSGSEAALFSVSLIRVRGMVQQNKPGAKALLAIKQKMERPIGTIVILNNIANIVGSILVGGIATKALGSEWLGLFSAVLTFLVIIFSEIIPKSMGETHSDFIAPLIARPVLQISRLFMPLLWSIEQITKPLSSGRVGWTTNESEIKLMAKIGHTEGIIEQDESEMIHRVFQLNDKKASDLMTPRISMTYVAGTTPLQEAVTELLNSQHSRILVVGETIDDVLGVVLKTEIMKAYIQGQTERPIADFCREIARVPKSQAADVLLKHFQTTRQHIAVVLDEYGGVVGVITLEDVLEVLTGEIVDETDKTVDMQKWARERGKGLLS